MYSYQNVIEIIENIAKNHGAIKSTGAGDVYEREIEIDNEYPLFFIHPETSIVEKSHIIYNFKLVLGDVLLKDKSNTIQILSNTQKYLLDIVSYLRRLDMPQISVEFGNNLTPFTVGFLAGCAGHTYDLSITVPYSANFCDTPIDTISLPPITPPQTIYIPVVGATGADGATGPAGADGADAIQTLAETLALGNSTGGYEITSDSGVSKLRLLDGYSQWSHTFNSLIYMDVNSMNLNHNQIISINTATVSINGVVNANSNKIINVADGTNPLDAVNYGQLMAASMSGPAGSTGATGPTLGLSASLLIGNYTGGSNIILTDEDSITSGSAALSFTGIGLYDTIRLDGNVWLNNEATFRWYNPNNLAWTTLWGRATTESGSRLETYHDSTVTPGGYAWNYIDFISASDAPLSRTVIKSEFTSDNSNFNTTTIELESTANTIETTATDGTNSTVNYIDVSSFDSSVTYNSKIISIGANSQYTYNSYEEGVTQNVLQNGSTGLDFTSNGTSIITASGSGVRLPQLTSNRLLYLDNSKYIQNVTLGTGLTFNAGVLSSVAISATPSFQEVTNVGATTSNNIRFYGGIGVGDAAFGQGIRMGNTVPVYFNDGNSYIYNSGDTLFFNGDNQAAFQTNGISAIAISTTQSVTIYSSLNMNSTKIMNVATGSSALDAVNVSQLASATASLQSQITTNTTAIANNTTRINAQSTRSVGVTIDAYGGVLSTGQYGYIEVPFTGTISSWSIVSGVTGSVVVDVWKAASPTIPTVADSIATSKPTLTSSRYDSASTSGWTYSAITAGDLIGWYIDSASSVTKITVELKIIV